MRQTVFVSLDPSATAPLHGPIAADAAIRPPRLAPSVARRILGGGMVAGAVGAMLFARGPGGAGAAIYLLILAAGLAGFSRDQARALPTRVSALLAAGAGFALLLVGRGSESLAVANAMAALFCITLASAFAKPGATRTLTNMRVRDLVALVPSGVVEAISGAPRFFFGDARAAFIGRDGSSQSGQAIAVVRAVAIGALLIVVFGLLLSGGDPVFRSVIAWPSWWDTSALPDYVVRGGVFACPAIALMWSTTRTSTAPEDVLANGITLNRLDVLVALASLNGLFGVYLLLQLRVLFGGSTYVIATTGLTVAQYARSGFFALAVAAGLVLTVLLALNALMRTDRLGGWAVSRRLSISLLIMVGLMLASATTRMLLYVQSFGITIDRIVALAIMTWLALTGVWFSLTVLRERSTRFVIGAVVAGGITLVALNALNPEAIVVRSALSRAVATGRFESEYVLRETGSDGVPALVEAVTGGALTGASLSGRVSDAALGSRAGTTNCVVANALLGQWTGAGANPLPQWTVSAARAAWAVSRNAAALRAQCATPPSER